MVANQVSAPGLASDPELYEGDQGTAVQTLQTLLRAKGYTYITVDGYFGSRTKSAVMDFQRKNGLNPDGIVGSQTWKALRGGTSGEVLLQEGDSGDEVRKLQTVLRACDYDVTVDGYFGTKTKTAVISFQRQYPQEVNADGRVAAKTLSLLWGNVLNEGDSGDKVRQAQQQLKNRSYDVVVNGTFDAKTKAAVMNFQRDRSLIIDGIIGRKTLAALEANTQPIRLVDVCTYYNPTQFPHQTAALEWLQRNIPASTLNTFAQLWRNPNA